MNGMLTLTLAQSETAARTAENDRVRRMRRAQADRRAAQAAGAPLSVPARRIHAGFPVLHLTHR